MKYIYKQRWSEDIVFNNPTDAAEHVLDTVDFHDEYDELLDDCWDETCIAGMYYNASLVLKRVDPIAYDCGYNDFMDSMESDIIERLLSLKINECAHFDMYTLVARVGEE